MKVVPPMVASEAGTMSRETSAQRTKVAHFAAPLHLLALVRRAHNRADEHGTDLYESYGERLA